MTDPADTRRRLAIFSGLACALFATAVGCSDSGTSTGFAHTTARAIVAPGDPAKSDADRTGEGSPVALGETDGKRESGVSETPVEVAPTVAALPANRAPAADAASARDRTFAAEGPQGALRIGYDDLDLLKILRMDPVTRDCVEKMPGWLRNLNGKPVRIRGFMKPGLLLTGIPQFMLVRDTGLCCFGPKGKIYDMIAVTLKPGVTTDYIELRPFDVVGTFRIELLELEDDGTIFGLYYIDDAEIARG